MATTGTPDETWSPWHEGERILQQELGVADRMTRAGAMVIRDSMPEQHRQFWAQLPFIPFGSVDDDGDAWAGIFWGRPGFLSSPDPKHLAIRLAPSNHGPANDDPAHAGLARGEAIGLLGIELSTRRRNRMNGQIVEHGEHGLLVEVGHSFGNCPQYIQQRDWEMARDPALPAPHAAETLNPDDPQIRSMIESADTFFVASYADTKSGRQVDLSHRGGRPGFVRMAEDGLLTVPDFAGNLHFNTLGNFLVNPRAGLLFTDFQTGDVLQLSGDAEVITQSPEIAAFEGAERLWTFRPRKAVLRRAALPVRFAMRQDGWSPNILMTGDWQRAARRLEARRNPRLWRQFRVSRIVEESSVIRSFHLEPADGGAVAPSRAGQHLPIRLAVDGDDNPVLRSYTLSSAPSDDHYRISVKREAEGRASRFLHDALEEGDVIEARLPSGNFTIDAAERRPAILIAAGVGITPMIAMLRHLVHEGKRLRQTRPSLLIQIARDSRQRAFDQEIDCLSQQAGDTSQIVRLVSNRLPEERPDAVEGRFSADLLRTAPPLDECDFFLCGPPGFMQFAYDILLSLGAADHRIFAEAFGPASLERAAADNTAITDSAFTAEPADHPVRVVFAASHKEARWTPDSGSLLDTAEERGLFPEHSCRSGSCGSCAVKLVSGAVAYPAKPSATIPQGEVLVCCAVPAEAEGGDFETLVIEL